VLVPEFVRRALQLKVGDEVVLSTSHYLDGNPVQGKVVPRLIGFNNDAELDFFEVFCTVDGVGTRKAMKAMVRPVREIANAIQREDVKWLTTLPGIGASTADKVVATLKRKVTRFLVVPSQEPIPEGAAQADVVDGNLMEELYQALMGLGMSPLEARSRMDRYLSGGRTFTSVEEAIVEIFKK
jgi:Holliday junction DNA helicase RuvA